MDDARPRLEPLLTEALRDQLQNTLGDGYAIERELGGGGMSHVFVAEEKAFGRRIVVKILPQETKADVSVERFKREIKVAARLQHPHIVPVLSAGELEGVPYYTMPFVKGESLRARLARSGELSVNEAVHYLRDVAAALAYAHSEGVVHRDIKPDNVIVSGGVAVVTDFGVSKAVDIAATEGDKATTGITSLGVALGTPAYMAPEQASADPRVDHRADIYSFGCLAYELLAGSSPFAGRPPQQMLAAHVTDTPEPLLKRRPQIPPALATLVMKCLEKRPGDRPQSADEIVATLDAIATPSGGMAPTAEKLRATRTSRLPWIIGASAILIAIIAGPLWFSRSSRFTPYTIGATLPIAVGTDMEAFPAISPDGKLVAYAGGTFASWRIYVRQIDGGRATMLASDLGDDQIFPSWSPDGSRIAFSARDGIYIIPSLTGGSPKRIIERGEMSSWSADGKQIVYNTTDGLFAYDLSTQTSRKIVGEAFLHSPAVSPDGRFVAYVKGRSPTFQNLSANSVFIVPMSGGTSVRFSDSTHVNLSPVWTPDGRSLLYVSNAGGTRDVFQQSVSSDGHPVGTAQRITTSLGSFRISLSANGSRMAYDAIRNYSNIYEVDITRGPQRVTAGKPVTHENQHIEAMDLSHDGTWLAYDSDITGNAEIYKVHADAIGDPVQLTSNSANDFGPSWSGDDKQIAFHTNRNGTRDIYVMNSEGNDQQQVTSGPDEDFYPSFSRDASRIVFWRESSGQNHYTIVARGPNGKWSAQKDIGMFERPNSNYVKWSPDGAFIAILMKQDVVLVDATTFSTRTIMTLTEQNGVAQCVYWAPDSKSLYVYSTHDGLGAIHNVLVSGGKPRLVLSDEPGALFGRWLFATDGKRLFYTRAAWEADVWVADLKRQ